MVTKHEIRILKQQTIKIQFWRQPRLLQPRRRTFLRVYNIVDRISHIVQVDKTQRAEFDSVASVDYGAGASRITAHKCRLIAISKCSISVFIIARTVIDGAQTDCKSRVLEWTTVPHRHRTKQNDKQATIALIYTLIY